ncbi:MAG: GNAT family N-acetyltransferase [Planctomycetes bacterium]|nr:GNAT family N-acetyltransferase [Planctomycetota bacterium]
MAASVRGDHEVAAGSAGSDSGGACVVRALRPADLPGVRRIDALHASVTPAVDWDAVMEGYLRAPGPGRVALAVDGPDDVAGFLLGEVRALEFGSEPCGWIFAVGVDPSQARRGVASSLLAAACARFSAAGVRMVRTMVERTDVPFLSFFRANGFVGGPYVQLEYDLADAESPLRAAPPPDAERAP